MMIMIRMVRHTVKRDEKKRKGEKINKLKKMEKVRGRKRR